MYQVVKRDGKIVDFNIKKIADAVRKAFDATGTEYNDDIIDFLALKVSADYQPKIKDGKVAVEDIQDSVETVLSRGGYETVAKAYILYRKNREKLRNAKSTYLDYADTVNKYVNASDWRVKENSTVTYSVGGLILSNSGAITANYWLSEVYDEEIANAHRNCDMHIHDLSMPPDAPPPKLAVLTDDEIVEIVQAAAGLGIEKIRITGGEPTVRPGIVELTRRIAAVPGIRELAMARSAGSPMRACIS